ncbi:MAG TPA: aldehyde dehydrogenase (NADP(+)) [Rhizomicrobium sp.]|jgi:NADP-dependent aldehyde dehydrogenase|nr:aldehyde dehydrogenase (NADP(+)) [Rhizomicrobium sp.]
MPLTGQLIVGFARVSTAETFDAVDAASGAKLGPPFSVAGPAEIERACALAQAAFDPYRTAALDLRARFLDTCAESILALGDELIARAGLESGLPRARLEGERGRTVGQLRLFADVVRRGDFLGVRVDPAQPERKPLARSDLRQRKIALGPVTVFGASNFPLAFSAAGGDMASALAAGCPVIVKAHPSHPGTSELVAGAISSAARACDLPEGTYSHLAGPANELGAALVADPRIKAVGFTGSRAGGLALVKIAAARPEPIPVYAEMSSINPIVLLPGALKARTEAIATGFVNSLTLGAGQFCTNPGLVLALGGPELDRFLSLAGEALAKTAPAQMLSANICANYRRRVDHLASRSVSLVARGLEAGGGSVGSGALFVTDAREFLADRKLGEEVFGPASLAVRCRDMAQLAAVLEHLEGQLTATLHLADDDATIAARLIPILERKAGRILANGWPTGVEVSPAMVHGGPFPATSDSRGTSVGTLAIERFLRPVCYQDLPDSLLPPDLQSGNPLGLRRMVDGGYTSS